MKQNEFIESVRNLGIVIDDEKINKLTIYKEYLQEYNKHTNLTTIINDEDIYLKHFYDSLTIVKCIDLNKIDNVLDVGSGAGFPGMVLKIFYPHLNVVLLDSNNKKTKFLESLAKKLNISILVVNERVEEYAKNNLNKFDLVTSRAVANLRVLSEISLPLVKENGYFIPLKGNIVDELDNAKDTIEIMNGKIIDIVNFKLYNDDNVRNIIKIKKIKPSKLSELRTYDKILKKSLVKK